MCCSKGFLKRLLPFFATFALGLFVASFFVTVAAPSFRFGNGWQRREEARRCRLMERQREREEYRFRTRQVRQNAEFSGDINELVPPPPPLQPIAPRPVQ